MNEYDFIQTINTPQLQDEIVAAGLSIPDSINTADVSVQIFYSKPLTDDQLATLTTVVLAHIADPNYVPLVLQNAINILTGYLNNPSPQIANTAKAVMIANIAPRLPCALIVLINAQIKQITGV